MYILKAYFVNSDVSIHLLVVVSLVFCCVVCLFIVNVLFMDVMFIKTFMNLFHVLFLEYLS